MHIHPTYERSKRLLGIAGWVALAGGVMGIALPFLPGIVLLLVGISLLSVNSTQAHYYLARLRVRFPSLVADVKKMETSVISFLQIGTHTHTYDTIPNNERAPLRILVEVSKIESGVAVVLHSASGTMETTVSNVLAEACRAAGYTVLRFDARHGLNEHGATFANFTTSAYVHDLEEVIAWAKTQSWWKERIVLVGHSIGGLVAAQYAQEHPEAVQKLILLAPTISGTSFVKAFSTSDPQGFATWKETRLRTVPHPLSRESFGLSYAFVEDLEQYDLLHKAQALVMPVTVLSGTLDVTSPPADCAVFATTIGPNAQHVTLPNVQHTPQTRSELATLRMMLLQKDS